MLTLSLSVVQTTDAERQPGWLELLRVSYFAQTWPKKAATLKAKHIAKIRNSSPGATRVRRIRHASASQIRSGTKQSPLSPG
jgi:hypothetical protein